MEKKKNTVLSAEEKTEMLSFLSEYPNIQYSKVLTKKQMQLLSLLVFTGNRQKGTFTMGYKYMSEVLGISRSTITTAIGKLESLKFITTAEGHRGVNTKYTINYQIMHDFEIGHNNFKSGIIQEIGHNNNEVKDMQYIEIQKDIKELKELCMNLNDNMHEIVEILNRALNINIKLKINNNNNIHDISSIGPEGIKENNTLIKNNNIISSEDKMDRMETVNEEKIEDLNVMNDTMKNNNFTSDVEAMQTDTTEISDTSKNINISDTESIEVVNGRANNESNVVNDDDNNTKDNDMIQGQTTDSSVDPDNIEGENESMNVENTEMNDTMKNNIPSEDNMKNKSIATTSIQLSVSNTTKNHEGTAAVGGGAENLRNGAGSVITSEVEQLPTATEKTQNMQPSYSNTEYNDGIDMFYLQHGVTREEYEEAQRSFMPNSWKNLTVHGIKIDNKTVTFTEVLNKLYSTTEIQISLTWWSKMCTTAKQYVNEGKMTESEYIKLRDEIIRLIEAKAKNIWYNTFKKYNNERHAFTYNNYIRKAWTITKNVITDEQKKSFTEEILNIN